MEIHRRRTNVSGRSRALLLAAALGLHCGSERATTFRDVVVDHSDRTVGEIVSGVVVEQTFVANHDDMSGVAVVFATYHGRAKNCRVVFSLRAAGASTQIYSELRECARIEDGGYARFDFPALPGSAGQRFTVQIESPNGRAGDAATLWMSSVPGLYPDGALTLAGVPTPGALRFITFHE